MFRCFAVTLPACPHRHLVEQPVPLILTLQHARIDSITDNVHHDSVVPLPAIVEADMTTVEPVASLEIA